LRHWSGSDWSCRLRRKTRPSVGQLREFCFEDAFSRRRGRKWPFSSESERPRLGSNILRRSTAHAKPFASLLRLGSRALTELDFGSGGADFTSEKRRRFAHLASSRSALSLRGKGIGLWSLVLGKLEVVLFDLASEPCALFLKPTHGLTSATSPAAKRQLNRLVKLCNAVGRVRSTKAKVRHHLRLERRSLVGKRALWRCNGLTASRRKGARLTTRIASREASTGFWLSGSNTSTKAQRGSLRSRSSSQRRHSALNLVRRLGERWGGPSGSSLRSRTPSSNLLSNATKTQRLTRNRERVNRKRGDLTRSRHARTAKLNLLAVLRKLRTERRCESGHGAEREALHAAVRERLGRSAETTESLLGLTPLNVLVVHKEQPVSVLRCVGRRDVLELAIGAHRHATVLWEEELAAIDRRVDRVRLKVDERLGLFIEELDGHFTGFPSRVTAWSAGASLGCEPYIE
jgi:hypothetical protein